ncbi:uncharacterized protein LOC114872226 isoform X2 [Osmia bicornis bicornis]|uniref:uncharacterized protein LOC114872226 isoform X2 n=1 Tax=Osmia bicornis bicornis TaxID=1437191 RepID=UPI001EAF7A4F|nr:uncharacterized protein LOC114872226 isoform X2 [Osmia bicornis bicornis]
MQASVFKRKRKERRGVSHLGEIRKQGRLAIRNLGAFPRDDKDSEHGKLEEKAVDGDFDIISLKKHLFQDIFMEHQKNNKLQFGYVCENPMQWEQRFEEKDFAENRHRGKVKWGNIDGSYGEHYWDLNHK